MLWLVLLVAAHVVVCVDLFVVAAVVVAVNGAIGDIVLRRNCWLDLMCVVCCLPFVCYLLFAICCSLVGCCLLPVACGLLFGCCLLAQGANSLRIRRPLR